jgi:glycosyltransferase involved in cell wall biosynthesis
MVESKPHQQIGYILRSYPRLSQTFILNEILELERSGVDLKIFAITNPAEALIQPQVSQVHADVVYLETCLQRPLRQVLAEHFRVLLRAPIRYLRAFFYTTLHYQIDQGYATSSRFACFIYAVFLIQLIAAEEKASGQVIRHLHAHFAHDPALIAQLAHRLTGIPYSFTAHARDLFQVPRGILAGRIRTARAVVTCCHANLDYLLQLTPSAGDKLHMIYHGVNLRGFQPAAIPLIPNTGAPLLVSVGRLVEKKGYFDLLASLEQVSRAQVPYRCEIYGEGPLRQHLQDWITAHHLEGQVILAGSRDQAELIPVLQQAVLFILTPSITEDGDREGIPNVLMEAMAVGLPVISTAIAGIPELITTGMNGLLFPPHAVDAIAGGIIDLLRDPEKSFQLGEAARRTVTQQFDIVQAAASLKQLFDFSPPPDPPELVENLSSRARSY